MFLVAYDRDNLDRAHVNLEEIDSCDGKKTRKLRKNCFLYVGKLMRAMICLLLREVLCTCVFLLGFSTCTSVVIGKSMGTTTPDTFIDMVAFLFDVIEQRYFAVSESRVICLLSQAKSGGRFCDVCWDGHMMRARFVVRSIKLELQPSAHIPDTASFGIPTRSITWKQNVIKRMTKLLEQRYRFEARELSQDVIYVYDRAHGMPIAKQAQPVVEQSLMHLEYMRSGNLR